MTSSLFIDVRVAEASDESSVQLLLTEAMEEQKKYRGKFPATDSAASTFVATVGESVVGVLQYAKKTSSAAVITCVHVHSSARDIGVGDALLLHTIRHLRTAGVTWLSGQAQPGDRALKNLFERHGLVAQTIVVGKSLSDLSTVEHASQ